MPTVESRITTPRDIRKRNPINGATPSTARQINRSIVLNLVRIHQPISRIELSNRTGIFRSNVSAIVDELVSDGLLIEQRAVPKGPGRVPVNLFLNPDGFRVLGISIRTFQTRVASSGLTGQIDTTVSFPTPHHPAAFVKELAKAIRRIRSESKNGFQEVGISVPGLVNADTGKVLIIPSLPGYSDSPLAEDVSALAGVPASAENDCNTAALAELWFNESEVAGLHDFVYVQVGDVGLGAGLIINSELYRGHDRKWVGEFGHMIIDPSGPVCECGRRGCWELYVSDRATWARYDANTKFTSARFEGLIQLAMEGDTRAAHAFRTTAGYLSLGLSNIVFALNPQTVVLAGEITKVWGLIQHTVELTHSSGSVKIHVYPARYNPDMLALQGAVVMALQKVFAPPRLS